MRNIRIGGLELEMNPWSFAFLIISGVATIALGIYLQVGSRDQPAASQVGVVTQSDIASIQKRLDDEDGRIRQLQSVVEGLATSPSQGRLAAQIRTLSGSVEKANADLLALQDALLDNPAKAVALPLLKRDLDNSRTSTQASILTLQQSVDHQYDLLKWMLGTFVLGLASVVLTVWAPAIGRKKDGS